MPSPKLRPRGRRDSLTFLEQTDLLAGPDFDAFPTPRLRREAWERHRDELIAISEQRGDGERPQAFWQYDAKTLDTAPECDWRDEERWPESERIEQDFREQRIRYLAERDLLTADELARMRKGAESDPFFARLMAVVLEVAR